MQAQMLHIIDIFAVDQRNIARDPSVIPNPFESILAGFQAKTEPEDDSDPYDLYLASERKRREELGI